MYIFMNIFHVEPSNQQKVVEILSKVTREKVSKAKGFHSSTLHRSSDGTKVAMYARWTNLADYEVMRRDPAPLEAFTELMTLARFEAGMYEIVEEFVPSRT